jgi:ribosomal protein S18 acetylase RimI-like enzyme
MELVPANLFTFDELTAAYNQTRVDYLVPMPMNVARLREYALVYDVNLNLSAVALQNGEMVGLGMVGLRDGRAWVTRLGVLPAGRRQGVGTAIMETLLDAATARQARAVWLEVIKGNVPGHSLFKKFGFVKTRELIVGRRPPTPTAPGPHPGLKRVSYLEHADAIHLLEQRPERPNWLLETESMRNVRHVPALPQDGSGIVQTVRNLSALMVELADGSQGWVTYQATFLQLTRIVVGVLKGEPTAVTAAVLHTLHRHHQQQDAIVENIPDDAVWQGFRQTGYFEVFRRIEMQKS